MMRAIDFETTGQPTEEDPHAVCEVGWCDLLDGEYMAPQAMFVDPRRPMPAEARGVHHIGDGDLFGAPPITTGFMKLTAGSPDVFVAHQADFEQAFFKGGEVPWICTYKVALRLWPDAPSHKLQVLRYILDLPVDDRLAHPPHRAGPDAYVCAALMSHILAEGRVSVADMIRWSKGPALLPRIRFGAKFKNRPWEEADDGYLIWIVEKSDLDRDVKANARHHLKLRGKL